MDQLSPPCYACGRPGTHAWRAESRDQKVTGHVCDDHLLYCLRDFAGKPGMFLQINYGALP